MTRALLWLLIIAGSVWSQPAPVLNVYTATCDVTLAATTTKCTVQQPATGARTVQFVEAYVATAAATDLTFTCNGTAATATAVTPVANNPAVLGASAATAWKSSDVGAGTACGPTIPILSANTGTTLSIGDYQLAGNGTAKNFTVAASSMTGRIVIVIKWREI